MSLVTVVGGTERKERMLSSSFAMLKSLLLRYRGNVATLSLSSSPASASHDWLAAPGSVAATTFPRASAAPAREMFVFHETGLGFLSRLSPPVPPHTFPLKVFSYSSRHSLPNVIFRSFSSALSRPIHPSTQSTNSVDSFVALIAGQKTGVRR